MNSTRFLNRTHAGQALANALTRYANQDDVLVLGLPRGGVPIAYEVARKLAAPLDVMLVRKLGVPGWEELAMGAIASGGVQVLNQDVIRSAMVSDQEVAAAAATQLKELQRRERIYRPHRGHPHIQNQTVILVDDGIATGSTIRAAVQALRKQNPDRIVIAVPVASVEASARLRPLVDDYVALLVPADFRAVGHWYDSFPQTSDAEVTELLEKAAALTPARESTAP